MLASFQMRVIQFSIFKAPLYKFHQTFPAYQYSHAIFKRDPEKKKTLFSSLFYTVASGYIHPQTYFCCLLTFQCRLTRFWFHCSWSFVKNSEIYSRIGLSCLLEISVEKLIFSCVPEAFVSQLNNPFGYKYWIEVLNP